MHPSSEARCNVGSMPVRNNQGEKYIQHHHFTVRDKYLTSSFQNWQFALQPQQRWPSIYRLGGTVPCSSPRRRGHSLCFQSAERRAPRVQQLDRMGLITQLPFVLVEEHWFSLSKATLSPALCMLFNRYINTHLPLGIGLRIHFKYSNECSRCISLYRFPWRRSCAHQ